MVEVGPHADPGHDYHGFVDDGYGDDDDDDDDDNDSENYEKHQPCLIGIERVRLSKTLFPIGSPKSKPGLIGDHHHQYIPDCSCLLACSDSC